MASPESCTISDYDESPRTEAVWDVFVRLFHWTLAAAFFTAYFTEGEVLSFHTVAGYAVTVLVLLRILWGFVGSRHARFSDFVFPLRQVFAYLGDMLRFRARRYIGHSPAGGAMIVVLMAVLLGTTFSGMTLYAQEEGKGPLAAFVGQQAPAGDAAAPALRWSDGDDDDDEGRYGRGERGEAEGGASEAWEEIHEVMANLALALVIFHVAGVIFSSLSHRENLVRAMIDGRKRPL